MCLCVYLMLIQIVRRVKCASMYLIRYSMFSAPENKNHQRRRRRRRCSSIPLKIEFVDSHSSPHTVNKFNINVQGGEWLKRICHFFVHRLLLIRPFLRRFAAVISKSIHFSIFYLFLPSEPSCFRWVFFFSFSLLLSAYQCLDATHTHRYTQIFQFHELLRTVEYEC